MLNNKSDVEVLVKILYINKKRDLVKHCKTLVIHERDFVDLVSLASTGEIEYQHKIYWDIFEPEHLQPSEKDFEALANNGLGELNEGTLKMFKKIHQIKSERRHIAGHMFYTPDFNKWHFFYFDQRDKDSKNNRWKYGPHIHFINYLWPNRTLQSVWSEFTNGNSPNMNGSIHIRFMRKTRLNLGVKRLKSFQ